MELEFVPLFLTPEDRELLNTLKSKLGVKTYAECFIHCLHKVAGDTNSNALGIFKPHDAPQVIFKPHDAPQVKFKLDPAPAPQVVHDIVNKMMEKGIVNVNIKDEKIVSGDTTFKIKPVKTGKAGLGGKGGTF